MAVMLYSDHFHPAVRVRINAFLKIGKHAKALVG